MKVAIFWDELFNNNNFSNLDLDKNLSPLAEFTKKNGIENTISLNLLQKREDRDEFVIFCFLTFSIFSISEYLKMFWRYPKNKKYFFLFEPSVIAPISYWKIVHLFFTRVYTWHDWLVDKAKYFKFIWPQSWNGMKDPVSFAQKKWIVLMNANKFSFWKYELYSFREKMIRYFEKEKIEFHLYGPGWGKANLKQHILRYFPYPSWKGRVEDKIGTIAWYKFNICFENMSDTPGYITEKIWDSFKAKTVPVYWGASNITDYVPKNCFIDYRDFWDFEKLYKFLSDMKEDEYNLYIQNIENFLQTKDAKKWFDRDWAQNFLNSLN